nr:hypothetical protein [Tanacetum cinerariifolium]
NSEVSITGGNKPKLSEAEDSTLSNHDISKHPLPPLEKLTDAEPISGPKTIESILMSRSTFKAKTLKGFTINKPSSAPARGNKSSSASKTNSAPAGLFLQEEESNLETLNTSQRTIKHVVAMFIPHLIDIEWFRKREALQAKKVKSFKAKKTDSSSSLRSKTY